MTGVSLLVDATVLASTTAAVALAPRVLSAHAPAGPAQAGPASAGPASAGRASAGPASASPAPAGRASAGSAPAGPASASPAPARPASAARVPSPRAVLTRGASAPHTPSRTRGRARGTARGSARGTARGSAHGAARGTARGSARGSVRGSARSLAASLATSPPFWLALVTAAVYVNQLLFTVYVERVHAGDPSFIARHLPAGWFELAEVPGALRGLVEHFPAPELLAPSVLRVQAFLELPFVLLAFATLVRWLDAALYRRIARSPLLPSAAVSYTLVFCLVEWDLHNPYTVDDVVIRAVSAAVTPLLLARAAARETEAEGEGEQASRSSQVPATVGGLLVFIGSLGALGGLVLVVYDTALLYNLGRLDDRLPLALAAAGALVCLRAAAPRLPVRKGPAPALTFVVHALRHWLTLFFVPALAVRYGMTLFGTPLLALAAGGLTAVLACAGGLRAARAGAGAVGGAVLAAVGGAALAVRLTPSSYEEVALLAGMAGFLVVGVAVCGLLDLRSAAVPADGRRPSTAEVSGRKGS